MKTTSYFERKVRQRNIRREWVAEAMENEIEREFQADGRIRLWGWVRERKVFFRVILLADGETLLNVFPDSNYTRKQRR